MADKEQQSSSTLHACSERKQEEMALRSSNTELDLSKTFAVRAWALCSEGRLLAMVLALVVAQANETAKKFVTALPLNDNL
jgi:hypothetical protein